MILPNGESAGVVSIKEAMRTASSYGLDLVEISPQAEPPVCKVADYGKMKYDLQKRKNEAKKNQKVVEIKEIKLTPMIGANDLGVKLNAIKRFLGDGNKVKISLKFRGREISHQDVGMKVIDKIIESISEIGKPDCAPKLEGKQMTFTLSPVSGNSKS